MIRKFFCNITLLLSVIPTFALTTNMENKVKTPIDSLYSYGIKIGEVQSDVLDEISGLVMSEKNPNCIWVHNDSGDDGNVYLINKDGELIATVSLGVQNVDWEDITLGDGYVYVGEIGDNKAIYPDKSVIRFAEPTVKTTELNQNITVKNVEIMRFNFADEQRDCESMFYDPITEELYFVTKRESRIKVYSTPFIETTDNIVSVEPKATMTITQATAADISIDGKLILVKNYNNIYYWERVDNEDISTLLSREPQKLNYIPEPQGEAIGWDREENQFYTISEKSCDDNPIIYKYKRN